MKRLFKWAFRLFLVLLVLAVAALLLLDTLFREITERRITARTGLRTTIGKMQVGLFNSRVTIQDLVIYNSAEFGGSPLVRVPELYAEYDRPALRSYKLHCRFVRLNIAEMNIVEDKNGRLNLEVLEKKTIETGGQILTTNVAKTGFQIVSIDTLNLSLGRAAFMSMKQPARVDELKTGLPNQVLQNVKNWRALDGVLTVYLMKNGANPTGIGKDTNNPGDRWNYWLNRLESMSKK